MTDDSPPESTAADEPPDPVRGTDSSRTAAYDEWPVGDETGADPTYVGLTSGGVPVFHDDGTVFRGEVDDDRRRIVPKRDAERTLAPGETLGDVIEEVGDALGWQTLSAFGREHRRDDG